MNQVLIKKSVFYSNTKKFSIVDNVKISKLETSHSVIYMYSFNIGELYCAFHHKRTLTEGV